MNTSNRKGPGAKNISRVPWMKKLESSNIQQYSTTQAFIDQYGWIAELPE